MAYKLQPKPYTPFFNTAISSTIASAWIEIGEYDGAFSVQVIWEGAVTPTITSELEVSNDKIHASTYPASSLPITGASGNNFYDIGESGARYMRVKITVTAGSANISALFNGRAG